MSLEAIAIASVGVGFGSLLLAGLSRINKRLDRMNSELTNQCRRLARLEGILTPRPWEDVGGTVPHEREGMDAGVWTCPAVAHQAVEKESD